MVPTTRTPSDFLPHTDNRFGWRYHLRHRAEFEAVFADKTHPPIRTRWFTLRQHDNELGYPRLGIAVSRRAVRRAVARNRIKRRIRETFRQQKRQLRNRDFVVTCHTPPGCTALPRGEIFAAVRQIWCAATQRPPAQ